MKKIFFFTGGDDLYGANKILFNTLPLFNRYERYVCIPNRGKLSDLIEKNYDDITIITLPNLPVIAKKYLNPLGIINFLLNIWRCKSILQDLLSDASIVYLNTLAVLPVSFYSKKYTILHVHEILNNSSLMNRIVNKIALNKADKIICVSKATSKNLTTIGDENQINKISTVYNGIPQIRTNQDVESSKSGKVTIVLIGRIKPQVKGQNYVLDALKYLSDETRSKILVSFIGGPVPGEEDDLINLIDRIEKENLSEIASIKQFTLDITKLYDEADICLVPSVREDPFPTTVLEAMSAKRPVIGTDLGGIPEMIDDSVTGFVIPLGNPILFAKKIEILVNDENLRHSMGENGYAKFINNFTLDGYENRFKKVLNTIDLSE